MKFITTIIKKYMVKDIPLPIGRWKIENCNTQIIVVLVVNKQQKK